MRTEIAKYQRGARTLKILGLIIFLFIILNLYTANIHYAIKSAIFFLLLPALFFLYKKIKASIKYYIVSFDKAFLYYTTSDNEIKIPLGDITTIAFYPHTQSNIFPHYHEYKIVYTDYMEEKSIRFWTHWDNRSQCDEFRQLVQINNPKVELINGLADEMIVKAQDKVTRTLNKISGKIFKSK